MGFQGSFRILTGTSVRLGSSEMVFNVSPAWLSDPQGSPGAQLTFFTALYFQERNVIPENEKH